jgi:hypothetical protein
VSTKRVCFRGVALVDYSGNKVNQVLFPRAVDDRSMPQGEPAGEWMLKPASGGKWKHPDQSVAVKHHPQLVLGSNDMTHVRVPLTDRTVAINDGNGKATISMKAKSSFFDLSKLLGKHSGGLTFDPYHSSVIRACVTSISLGSGDISVEDRVDLSKWSLADDATIYDKPKPLAIGFDWQSDAATIEIVVRDLNGDIVMELQLNDDMPTIWIVNGDEETPTPHSLDRPPGKAEVGDSDEDFRWVYRLLDPRSPNGPRSWREWKKNSVRLPAPRLAEVNGMVNVSTCFPALWGS